MRDNHRLINEFQCKINILISLLPVHRRLIRGTCENKKYTCRTKTKQEIRIIYPILKNDNPRIWFERENRSSHQENNKLWSFAQFLFFSFIWFLLYCIARVPSYIVCRDNTTISCRSRYIRINIDITEDCRWALGYTGRKFEYETVR